MARLMPGWDDRRPQRRQSVACERFDTDKRRPGYRLFVPARTNRHQAVVFYVKQQIAPEGAQVTESKELFDVDSGKCREVDIVVDCLIGGNGSPKTYPELGHIPLSEWLKWSTWFAP